VRDAELKARQQAITADQTRGQFGLRDIHRRPVEFVPIPRFDPGEEDHATLAELSRQMHVSAGAIPFDSQHHREAFIAMLVTQESAFTRSPSASWHLSPVGLPGGVLSSIYR
jgi:hypothetical protein